MSAAFVPLVPGVNLAANLSTPTRLKPIPAAAPGKFEPTIPANHKSEPSVSTASATPHVQHGPPKVTVEREGESVTHIRIECSCGQVTELKCEY